MASIPELLNGHVTLEVECLDRLYLNGYIGPLATSGGLVTFMREQLGKPIPSPVVLGQVTEKFREAVKALAERQEIPVYQFNHKERKDDVANDFRRKRGVRDGIVFVGVAQEKAQAFQGKKVNGQFLFTRDKRSTSTTTTSTSTMPTSGRCSSKCAATRRGGPSCV
ncbi:MAG: hypothetical protein U0Q16_32530 [Bryobacteraceae bacterium]